MATADRAVHEGLGAYYEAFDGIERPGSYGDVPGEFRSLREDAGLVDAASLSYLAVRGADRSSFLSRLVSNDVEALEEGRNMAALLLTPRGMLISPLTVHHLRDHFLIATPSAVHENVLKKLVMYVLSASVEVEDVSGRHARIGVHGPKARAVLAEAGITADALVENEVAPVAIAGAQVLVARARDLGVPGFEILHAPESSAEVIRAVVAAGAKPAGWRAAEAVRILAGEARFGAEIKEGMLPPEVPALAERAISYTKGCYVGQETISRLKNYGRVNRELRGLVLGGEKVPEPGTPVTRNGERVGVVSSACLPPDRDHPVALAFMHRKHFEVGARVEVEMRGGLALARVVAAGGPW